MRENLKKFNLVIVSIVFLIVFIISKTLLNTFNIDFMSWVYYLCFNIFYIMFILGIIKVIIKSGKNSKITKIVKTVCIMAIIFVFVIVTGISVIFQLLIYKPTHIVIKDNQKMEVSVFYWDRLFTLNYYKYINPFLRSYKYIETDSFIFQSELHSITREMKDYDPFVTDNKMKEMVQPSLMHSALTMYKNILSDLFWGIYKN